jgi:hypothetical protein
MSLSNHSLSCCGATTLKVDAEDPALIAAYVIFMVVCGGSRIVFIWRMLLLGASTVRHYWSRIRTHSVSPFCYFCSGVAVFGLMLSPAQATNTCTQLDELVNHEHFANHYLMPHINAGMQAN